MNFFQKSNDLLRESKICHVGETELLRIDQGFISENGQVRFVM
jgi:hypothetical protein